MSIGAAQAARPAVVDALAGGVSAATLTPFDPDGAVRLSAVEPYARTFVDAGVESLAVCVHTGRGAHLDDRQRAALIREFGGASGLPVVAGIGIADRTAADAAPASTPAGVADLVLASAAPAVEAGAAALLLFPPPPLPDAGRGWVVDLHQKVADRTGLPVIAFVLYEQASGFCYDPALVGDLAAAPGVAGVKLATLDDAIACQDLIAACRGADPATIAITGEDRMFGPSLMWGCSGALVGIAAALPEWTVRVHQAWREGRHGDFLDGSGRLDRLAALVFRAPMEHYIQRMAWIAEWTGSLPADVCRDPFAPPAVAAERSAFLADLAELVGR